MDNSGRVHGARQSMEGGSGVAVVSRAGLQSILDQPALSRVSAPLQGEVELGHVAAVHNLHVGGRLEDLFQAARHELVF